MVRRKSSRPAPAVPAPRGEPGGQPAGQRVDLAAQRGQVGAARGGSRPGRRAAARRYGRRPPARGPRRSGGGPRRRPAFERPIRSRQRLPGDLLGQPAPRVRRTRQQPRQQGPRRQRLQHAAETSCRPSPDRTRCRAPPSRPTAGGRAARARPRRPRRAAGQPLAHGPHLRRTPRPPDTSRRRRCSGRRGPASPLRPPAPTSGREPQVEQHVERRPLRGPLEQRGGVRGRSCSRSSRSTASSASAASEPLGERHRPTPASRSAARNPTCRSSSVTASARGVAGPLLVAGVLEHHAERRRIAASSRVSSPSASSVCAQSSVSEIDGDFFSSSARSARDRPHQLVGQRAAPRSGTRDSTISPLPLGVG